MTNPLRDNPALLASVLAEEQLVLDDIFRRTGLRFRFLGSFDRNNRETMRRILPIVREWTLTASQPIKHALYFSFLTLEGRPYIDDILAWFQSETDNVSREVLTQIMRRIVTSKTATRIWQTYNSGQPTDSESMLLSRLARMPSVSEPVADRILAFLEGVTERIDRGELVRTFAISPVQLYSRVRHPKVKAWFRQYLTSRDPDLRAAAKRSFGIKPVLPAGCLYARMVPDPSRLILSTEIDSDRLAEFLRNLESDIRAELVPSLPADHVVENLLERKWLVYYVARTQRGPLELWFRLEDTCTVEVWVTTAQARRPN